MKQRQVSLLDYWYAKKILQLLFTTLSCYIPKYLTRTDNLTVKYSIYGFPFEVLKVTILKTVQ